MTFGVVGPKVDVRLFSLPLVKMTEDAKKTNRSKFPCPYCSEPVWSRTAGPHIIKHHYDDLKQQLMPYAKTPEPTAPYIIRDFYLCLVCRQYHKISGVAKNHLNKTGCSAEHQLEAIYTMIGTRPNKTTITVAQPVLSDKYLTERLKKANDKNELLEAQNAALNRRIATLTGRPAAIPSSVVGTPEGPPSGPRQDIDELVALKRRIATLEAATAKLPVLRKLAAYGESYLRREERNTGMSRSKVIADLGAPPEYEDHEFSMPVVAPPAAKLPSTDCCKNCKKSGGTMISCHTCTKPIHQSDEEIRCKPRMCEAYGCDEMFCHSCAEKWQGDNCPNCRRPPAPPRPAGPMPVPGSYNRY
jgi:hypothetical protein